MSDGWFLFPVVIDGVRFSKPVRQRAGFMKRQRPAEDREQAALRTLLAAQEEYREALRARRGA